jgi:transposase InsO family protein
MGQVEPCDNPKTIVLDRATANARLNPRLEDCCRCYGYTPRLSRPYRVRTKGKIESERDLPQARETYAPKHKHRMVQVSFIKTPDSIFPSRYPLTRKASLKEKRHTGLIRGRLTHLLPKGGDFAATLS